MTWSEPLLQAKRDHRTGASRAGARAPDYFLWPRRRAPSLPFNKWRAREEESCLLLVELGVYASDLGQSLYTHSLSCLRGWWPCFSSDWGSWEGGVSVPGEATESPSFPLPSVGHCQISGRLGRGYHSEGAILWLEWAQHLCIPGQPGPCLALCVVAGHPGLVRYCFCRVTLVTRPQVGWRSIRAVAWGCQAAGFKHWLYPCCVTLVKDLTSPSLSFPLCRLGT